MWIKENHLQAHKYVVSFYLFLCELKLSLTSFADMQYHFFFTYVNIKFEIFEVFGLFCIIRTQTEGYAKPKVINQYSKLIQSETKF